MTDDVYHTHVHTTGDHNPSFSLCLSLNKQDLLVQQSSVKRLEQRIKSASDEKDKLERELMKLQSELKTGQKTKQGLESENAKLSGTYNLYVYELKHSA